MNILLLFFCFICPLSAEKIPMDIAREIIAPLIDPAKVATLKGDRPANEWLYKVQYWLEMARLGGVGIGSTIDKAQVHLNIEQPSFPRSLNLTFYLPCT